MIDFIQVPIRIRIVSLINQIRVQRNVIVICILLLLSNVMMVRISATSSVSDSTSIARIPQQQQQQQQQQLSSSYTKSTNSNSINDENNRNNISLLVLQEYIKARVGNINVSLLQVPSTSTLTSTGTSGTIDTTATWIYEGILVDPLNGTPIASVEGIELICPIASYSHTTHTNNHNHHSTKLWNQYKRRCRNLQIVSIIKDILQDQHEQQQDQQQDQQLDQQYNENNDIPPPRTTTTTTSTTSLVTSTAAVTFLTRKLFLYKPLETTKLQSQSQSESQLNRKQLGIVDTVSSVSSNQNDVITTSKVNPQHHHQVLQTSTTTTTTPWIQLLLQKYQRRPPIGPTTIIPLDQSIQMYDSVTTLIATSSSNTNTNTNTNNNTKNKDNNISSNNAPVQMIVHTEWPDGSTAQSATNNIVLTGTNGNNNNSPTTTIANDGKESRTTKSFSFSTYSRLIPSSLSSVRRCHHNSLKKKGKKNKNKKKNKRTIVSDNNNNNNNQKRIALIQFGSLSSSSSHGDKSKFGSRETYTYMYNNNNINDQTTITSTIPSSSYNTMVDYYIKKTKNKSTSSTTDDNANTVSTVRYTRYGEGPVWYGPGRMCLLELTGRRIGTSTGSSTTSSMDSSNLVDSSYRSTKSTSDSSSTTSSQDDASTISIVQTIANTIPNFWDIFSQQQQQQQQQTSMQQNNMTANDSENFQYYSNALLQQLQKYSLYDDDNDNDDEIDDTHSNNNIKNIDHPINSHELSISNSLLTSSPYQSSTTNEHQQIYNDYKIGRMIDRFRTNPTTIRQLRYTMKHNKISSINKKNNNSNDNDNDKQETKKWDRLQQLVRNSNSRKYEKLQHSGALLPLNDIIGYDDDDDSSNNNNSNDLTTGKSRHLHIIRNKILRKSYTISETIQIQAGKVLDKIQSLTSFTI